ncbi:leucine-rich repeat domain-containing protein [Flammeovirga sp. SJP92]|uniref:leucine-rich repeat domain-containing protein n=1 Tax=Flammeovirga sp. SJP92 TaxID=1775430 RepID=UPI000787D628|nr:hypothetical protein [Flammeovirga sp. SJP92]KXX66723.1 hypothetical protein AVL50_30695 [Flammeovirga sp. SJP92]
MDLEEVNKIILEVKKHRLNSVSLVNFKGEIPEILYDFDWVKKLYFFECPKVKLSSIARMSNLNELHIRYCKLESFVDLSDLKSLNELNLEGNDLTKIPPNLPSSITSFDISENELEDLDNVLNLGNLIELYAIENKIKKLPNFNGCPNIELFDVSNNGIITFPKELFDHHLERIKKSELDIHISGNPFIEIFELEESKYSYRSDWGHVEGVSHSKSLFEDYKRLYKRI